MTISRLFRSCPCVLIRNIQSVAVLFLPGRHLYQLDLPVGPFGEAEAFLPFFFLSDMQTSPYITALFILSLVQADASFIIEKEYETVTFGSWVKLAHKATGYRLHSHDITYGTGSRQQSVTGFPHGDDSNSLFRVTCQIGQVCRSGTSVQCGDVIRLQHQNTKKYLHSHSNIASPLSNNQEVSAHDRSDTNDYWKVVCDGVWKREEPVYLGSFDSFRTCRYI